MSDTINIKESLLKVVNDNNLEILKIDLYNEGVSFAKYANIEQSESCTYTTLESLDFEEDSDLWGEKVLGTVYCQDKNTKEPVWVISCCDEAFSWWQVNRVPEFYKRKALNKIKLLLISARNRFRSAIDGVMIPPDERYREKSKAFEELEKALKELEDEK